MKTYAFLQGIYPRSEGLVTVTQAQERGRLSAQEVRAQFERDLTQLLERQRAAGLDLQSDGALNWADLFRPLLEIADGLEAGPLVRFFDNNTFYRQPVIRGKLELRQERLADWLSEFFHLDRGITVASLPSPYFFSQAAQARPGHSPAALLETFGQELLLPIAQALAEKGLRLLLLHEPWLAVHGPAERKHLVALQGALQQLKTAIPKVEVGLITYFGDAAPIYEQLRQLDVEAIGVDFWETDLAALAGRKMRQGLICGCFDARSSLLEEPKMVAEFLDRVEEGLDPKALYLTTNAGLEFVPEAIAREKIGRIGQAARMRRDSKP